MFAQEEIDENVVAVALYKLREVNGGTNVERINVDGPPSEYPMIGFDPIANSGIILKVEGIQAFLPFDQARDMCSLQFGDQIAENFIKKIVNKE